MTETAAIENTKKPLNLSASRLGREVNRRIEEFQILRKLGQTDEARKILNALLKEYPHDAGVLQAAAFFFLETGEWNKARDLMEELVGLKPEDPDLLNALAEIYYQLNDDEKAVKFLKGLHELNGGDFRSHRILADILAKTNDPQAREEYERALKLIRQDPSVDTDSILEQAEILWKLERTDEAIGFLESMVERFPKDPAILKELANYYREEGDLALVKAYLEKLKVLSPNDPDLLKNLGELYFQLDDYASAAKFFADYSRLKPDDYYGYYLLGQIFGSSNHPWKARRNYQKAYALLKKKNRREPSEVMDTIDILVRLQSFRTAQGKLGGFLKNNANPSVLKRAFYLSLDLDNEKQAADIIKTLRQAQSAKMQDIQRMEVSLLMRRQKWTQVRPILEDLRRSAPKDRDLQLAYAETLVNLREWDLAQSQYRDLLKQKGVHSDTVWNYRDVLARGRPQVRGQWTYQHRPQSQRNYRLDQQARFWINNRWAARVGATEEVYRQESNESAEEIDEFITSQFLEARTYLTDSLSASGFWSVTEHDGRGFHEGIFRAGVEKPRWQSQIEYQLNHLVRDPVIAIAKGAQLDRVKLDNRFKLLKNCFLGHQFSVEWYRVDKSANPINGEDALGAKFANDVFFELLLAANPYISVSYHFKRAHWDKEFERADEVVDFLGDEQIHYGIFYFEEEFGDFLEVILSVTPGKDVKRNTHFIDSVIEARIWFNDYANLSLSYEYDEGDSGLAGSGNSQIMSAAFNYSF